MWNPPLCKHKRELISMSCGGQYILISTMVCEREGNKFLCDTIILNTVVWGFLSQLHIAHCNQSHDYSIGNAESRMNSDGI